MLAGPIRRTGDILIVDDEPAMRRTLAGYLRHAGYRVREAASGHEALEHLRCETYDLAILDLQMPGMSGTEVLQAAQPMAPETMFIILTAFGSLDSAIVAIRHGAFDYLLKPTPVDQIAATVDRALAERKRRISADEGPVTLLERALLQLKSSQEPPAQPADRFLQAEEVTVDTQKQLVVVGGRPVDLTLTEYGILAYLLRHRNRVVSCRELVAHLQNQDLDERDARVVLRSHIHRLRCKIERDPANPRLVCTVRGSGYTFAAG